MTLPPHQPIQKYVIVSAPDDLAGFWVDALGWIACYFAQLEGLSYAIIGSLGSLHHKKHAAKMRYQERTDFARKLICAHFVARGDIGLAKEWATLLGEVKDAAPLRNKILHNPLGIDLLTSHSMVDPDQGIVLVNAPGRPVIKLGAVQAFAKSIAKLNQRMLDLKLRSGM
jgi:hypothetical protein